MKPRHYAVEFSRFVTADLENIVRYLDEQGAGTTALALVDEILSHIAILEEFPRCGNLPKELLEVQAGEVRQLVVSQYRLFYEIEGNRIVFLMLADGRRNIAELLVQRISKMRAEKQ